MKIKGIILIFFSFIFLSCHYSFRGTYSYGMKSVKINLFSNETTEFSIDNDFLAEFIKNIEYYTDLKVLSGETDCFFRGKIYNYKNENYIYDFANKDKSLEKTEAYKMYLSVYWELVKVDEHKQEEILWKGEITESIIYNLGDKTLIEAQEENKKILVKKLAENSVIRIFEGW